MDYKVLASPEELKELESLSQDARRTRRIPNILRQKVSPILQMCGAA